MAQAGPYIDIGSHQAGRNFIDLRWTSGASGAVASVDATKKYGFDSTTPVAHGATGVYTLTTSGQWADYIGCTVDIIQASYSASGACKGRVTAYSLANKTVTILITTAAGAAVEPTTGDVITVTLTMQQYLNP